MFVWNQKNIFLRLNDLIKTYDAIIEYTGGEKLSKYINSKIDEEFNGKINGVVRAGLFISLTDTGGEGFVPISSLVGDYFHYDKDHQLLKGENSGITFQLGDTVTVKLREANPISGGLIFQVINEKLMTFKLRKSSGKNSRRPRNWKRK